MATDEAAGQDQFKPVAAPTDCRVQPQGVNRRAGYGSTDDRTERVILWLTKYPDATLASGEGVLLLNRIRQLEDRIQELEGLLTPLAEY